MPSYVALAIRGHLSPQAVWSGSSQGSGATWAGAQNCGATWTTLQGSEPQRTELTLALSMNVSREIFHK